MSEHGGRRTGAGRPRGAKTRITEEAVKRAGDGETPLEYMLRVMRDNLVPNERRDEMALAAAPYVHAKYQQVDLRADVETTQRVVSEMTEAEWLSANRPQNENRPLN